MRCACVVSVFEEAFGHILAFELLIAWLPSAVCGFQVHPGPWNTVRHLVGGKAGEKIR